MTISNIQSNKDHTLDRKILVAGLLIGSMFLMIMLRTEFHNEYLHNPSVHIFFQSKGIFLF